MTETSPIDRNISKTSAANSLPNSASDAKIHNMSSRSFTELVKLPPGERAELAMALWDSLSADERQAEPLRVDRPRHAHAQPALVDLVGRVPGAPPELPPAHAHPWRQGWRHGWRSPLLRCEPAGFPVVIKDLRLGAAVAKPKDARVGVIEREDIWGRPVAPCLARWGARPRSRRVAPRPPQARSP